MPLQRNEFIPQSMTTVYTSPSGMTDIRTGQPYRAGGLYPNVYFDLTEKEAQAYGPNLHSGRYRFVQIDSTATASNLVLGSIALMKTFAQGLNFITSYDLGLSPALRQVVMLQTLTSAQVLAGAWVFVQELGIATVQGKTGGVTNASPAVGDVINVISPGTVDDLATPGTVVSTTVGFAVSAPNHTGTATFLAELALPVLQD